MDGRGQYRHLGKVARLGRENGRIEYKKEYYKLLLSLLIRDYLITERPNERLMAKFQNHVKN